MGRPSEPWRSVRAGTRLADGTIFEPTTNENDMSKPKNKNEFSRRDFLKGGSAATLMTMLGTVPLAAQPAPGSTSAAPEGKDAPKDSDPDADFPRVWLSSP